MGYKFERLEVWRLALDYIDLCYAVAAKLPKEERYNLSSQLCSAATSIALNIAEGSTGQTDAEQARFLGNAIRSLLETVACQHLIHRRKYLPDPAELRHLYRVSQPLMRKLQSLRKTLCPHEPWVREEEGEYETAAADPF